MFSKLIKLVLLSLLVCFGFAGRVLYSCLFNRVVQGKDPRHIFGVTCGKIHQFYEKLSLNVQALEMLGKLGEVNGYV